MELIKVIKEKEQVKVVLKVGESKQAKVEDIEPTVENVNYIVFNNKEEAIKYFKSITEHNLKVIEDNESRLNQMDTNALEKINDFTEIIKKTKALSKRNSQKIEELIGAHENMLGFKLNIKTTKERNKINEDILAEINKL